ncbi:MAG: HD domain-containing protein [Deltaproteobacteria bacterium]|jgi:putative hydrolase of HD superfamily|nr:HD domain-containing protein [Deltaproteobacteria bacterium]
MKRITDFIFEGLFLKKTPRSGFAFLGRGRESVAEHSFGATFIAYVLGQLARLGGKEVDLEKLLTLTLFHDLAEARTGDLNYVNKRYLVNREDLATNDALDSLPFRDALLSLREEWIENKTLEARLSRDADQLDMLVELKKHEAEGSPSAGEWIEYCRLRLKTDVGLKVLESILESRPDDWWFAKKEEYWVDPKGPEPPRETAPDGAPSATGKPAPATQSAAEKPGSGDPDKGGN